MIFSCLYLKKQYIVDELNSSIGIALWYSAVCIYKKQYIVDELNSSIGIALWYSAVCI